ncbi:MAG: L,D-transpeptidase family protein [Parafilimonas sp.]|nr:L,D-transpeptidase family protein [Parafilimonas sp.]
MKNFFCVSIILSILFTACNNQHSNSQTNSSATKTEKKISSRNRSITASNSYSDLFFDSTKLESFITQNAIADSVAIRMRSFYNARNYQYAWFTSNGLTEQALGFWNLRNYTIYSGDTSLKNKPLEKEMDDLTAEDSMQVSASDSSVLNTELLLTQSFINYTLSKYENGYVKRKEAERFIPFKKEDATAYADSLINKKHKDDKYFDDVNDDYKALKGQLAKYLQIVKSGGWPQVEGDAKSFKKGASSPQIALLKKRLQISGDMQAHDTSAVFDDTLTNAIKAYQGRIGLTQNGEITADLLKDINITAQQRLQQILINMNRMRWMPQEPQGQLILVNIPEFILHFVDGKNKVFDMVVVVGKEGHNTMMFTGKLSQIVFSPYWNVPPSIVKKEILPKMQSNPNYLKEQNMEVTGNSGGLPVIRQLPGEKNSLGRVKFLFPNSYNIYFHDTPAKSLFSKDKRAFSHGCIRLSEPEKMADYLLRDQPQWTPDKIEEAMNSGNQQFVNIKNPVPVFITYYTAWVDENGQLNFRDDIYNRDSTIAGRMF